jgi:hypothetical protein
MVPGQGTGRQRIPTGRGPVTENVGRYEPLSSGSVIHEDSDPSTRIWTTGQSGRSFRFANHNSIVDSCEVTEVKAETLRGAP